MTIQLNRVNASGGNGVNYAPLLPVSTSTTTGAERVQQTAGFEAPSASIWSHFVESAGPDFSQLRGNLNKLLIIGALKENKHTELVNILVFLEENQTQLNLGLLDEGEIEERLGEAENLTRCFKETVYTDMVKPVAEEIKGMMNNFVTLLNAEKHKEELHELLYSQQQPVKFI